MTSEDTIVADFAAIFAESDLKTRAECHAADPLCVPMFRALGIDLATGQPLPTQNVFRVE